MTDLKKLKPLELSQVTLKSLRFTKDEEYFSSLDRVGFTTKIKCDPLGEYVAECLGEAYVAVPALHVEFSTDEGNENIRMVVLIENPKREEIPVDAVDYYFRRQLVDPKFLDDIDLKDFEIFFKISFTLDELGRDVHEYAENIKKTMFACFDVANHLTGNR